MPTEGTKLILLPLDVRLEFVFYSGGFLYKSIGQIVERFKRDNIYTLEVELKTRLEKFQRREFYRYECSIDFKFFELTEEQADLATVEEIFAQLRDEHFNDKIRTGTIVDISGGGIRFNSDTELKSGDHILAVAHLANERMNTGIPYCWFCYFLREEGTGNGKEICFPCQVYDQRRQSTRGYYPIYF